MPILRSIQYVTFKYGDFQKASRISLREPSISINSIIIPKNIINLNSFKMPFMMQGKDPYKILPDSFGFEHNVKDILARMLGELNIKSTYHHL